MKHQQRLASYLDKNSTPWSKTKPLFRAFKNILSRCNINVILDLHVSHVGGEAQKNILSILLWAPATFVPRDWLQVKNNTLLNVVVDQSISDNSGLSLKLPLNS